MTDGAVKHEIQELVSADNDPLSSRGIGAGFKFGLASEP